MVGFDHLVLVVADVERSLAFYVDRLGLAPERVEAWRREEVFFPSVRVDATTVIDLVAAGPSQAATSASAAGADGGPAAGAPASPIDRRGTLDHLCLVVMGADLAALAADPGFDVLEGPVPRWGAQGDGTSVYVRDPDGVVVELRTYP